MQPGVFYLQSESLPRLPMASCSLVCWFAEHVPSHTLTAQTSPPHSKPFSPRRSSSLSFDAGDEATVSFSSPAPSSCCVHAVCALWRICSSTRPRIALHRVPSPSTCCCCLVTESCLTLFDPVDFHLPGSSVHRVSQAKYWRGLPFPS